MERIAQNERRQLDPARAGLLALMLIAAAPVVQAQRTARLNVIEHVTRAMEKDDGFSRRERLGIIDAIGARFADYAFQIVPGETPDSIRVVMRMIIEGQFDGVSNDRIADVAFAAYQAISRGAPADVVEGIALYGYRKKVPAERISVWANGYHQLVEQEVPGAVAADLVRNAMEHSWEDGTFNTLKWALVRGRRDGFDMEDYATYIFGGMLAGGERPGRLTADARSYFKRMASRNQKPKLPKYQGSFERGQPHKIEYEAVPRKPNSEIKKPKGGPEAKAPPRPKRRLRDLEIARVWPGLDQSSRSYLGTPYVWGGNTRRGMDCSALTKNTYGENKIRIPRVSRKQWKIGKPVKKRKLRKGDLVFFNTQGVGVSHVGMVVAGKPTRFIHASSSRGVVVDKLSQRWFKKRYLGGRRIVP